MLRKREDFDKLMLESLCKEYQSLWLLNVADRELNLYRFNDEKTFDDVSFFLKKSNNYDLVRNWYIDCFVIEEQRERVREESLIEHVLNELKYSSSYVIEFDRVIGEKINLNQIIYTKINPEEDRVTNITLAFRNADVKEKAERDELTGIYNRKAFFWHAEKMLKKYPDRQFDLILSDYVNFKSYNESYGMKAGDELLAGAGVYLDKLTDETTVVGRYGGDQFVVLLEHSKYERFINTVNGTSPLKDRANIPDIEVKYGVCKNINHDKSIVLYCDRAHIAVNTIKHIFGQKVAEFNDDIKGMLEKQRAIEEDMQKALDEEQFKVYYQPKHDAKTGKLVGAEALVRWIHPVYGFMSPADFIPIFERNGFIVKLDLYVFKRTCMNLRKWLDAGLTMVPISVNASKLTMESQGMVFSINKSMRESNIPGNLVHLEITESLMGEDSEVLIRRLEPLKKKGIQVELDDFGAGYSSVNMLSTLPLDVIKLDMSFMKQFGDYKRAKVLEGCVNLAKSLGYKTVSEGVETQDQLDTLKRLGVDIIQGYFFSKPLPEDAFEEYTKSYKKI